MKIGDCYGRWTVIDEPKLVRRTGRFYLRQVSVCCDCGTVKKVWQHHLRDGRSKSCGCLRREILKKRQRIHGCRRNRLGNRTCLYETWSNMLQRCSNPRYESYVYYGARGIKVCREWHTFVNFKAWARKSGYKKHLTIERRNNYRNYCPSNCRWATRLEQARHKRPRKGNGDE